MKLRQPFLLLHPLFLVSIALLLLNDFFLKYQYHNWLTGKLSDFSGLFAFCIFLRVILPLPGIRLVLFVALFFTWWKSPLSEPIISFFNQQLSIPVKRVVDYTDLLALSVLPGAALLRSPVYSPSLLRTFSICIVSIFSLFGFCATSVPRQIIYYPFRQNEIRFNETFISGITEQEFVRRLDPTGQGYLKDSVKYYNVSQGEDIYYRVNNDAEGGNTWIPISNTVDSMLFVRRVVPAFYTFPQYVLEGDTLINLEISVAPHGKKKKDLNINVESFQLKNTSHYNSFYDGKLNKKYKKHFRKLFRN